MPAPLAAGAQRSLLLTAAAPLTMPVHGTHSHLSLECYLAAHREKQGLEGGRVLLACQCRVPCGQAIRRHHTSKTPQTHPMPSALRCCHPPPLHRCSASLAAHHRRGCRFAHHAKCTAHGSWRGQPAGKRWQQSLLQQHAELITPGQKAETEPRSFMHTGCAFCSSAAAAAEHAGPPRGDM